MGDRPRRPVRPPHRYGADAPEDNPNPGRAQDRPGRARNAAPEVPLQVLQDHAPLLAMQQQLHQLMELHQELRQQIGQRVEPPAPAAAPALAAPVPAAPAPVAAPAPAFEHQIKKMPRYDGTTDYNLYRVQFDQTAMAQRWSEATKGTLLLQALQGAALNVLKHLPTPITFENLDKELVHQFGKTHSLWHDVLAFSNIKQKSDQSLEDFAKECSILGRAAHRCDPDDVLQQRLVKAFIAGLQNQTFHMQLSCQVHASLDAALQAALQAESWNITPSRKVRVTAVEGEATPALPTPSTSTQASGPSSTLSSSTTPAADYMTILQTLTKKVDDLLAPSTTTTNSNNGNNYRPNYRPNYHRVGNNNNKAGNFNHNNRNAAPRKFIGHCYQCNRVGHMARECWHREGNEHLHPRNRQNPNNGKAETKNQGN